mgnify:CR=1 FL=1
MPLKTFSCDLLESQNCDDQGMIKGNLSKNIQTLYTLHIHQVVCFEEKMKLLSLVVL